MDAASADADVKLYKASGELLAELQQKLPLLLCRSDGKARKWVLWYKTAELSQILDTFQEWPQLLDPILADLITPLATAFIRYCVICRDVYHPRCATPSNVEPLPRSICRLLYVFCKVRGYKIVVRLLNNEPKYIEPLLASFQQWTSPSPMRAGMCWEERYIMMLWLSHLMLAPFELISISGFSTTSTSTPAEFEKLNLPEVSRVLLDIALKHLFVPGKDRESAALLIVRLSLRGDMQTLGLPKFAVLWCTQQLLLQDEKAMLDQYRHVGLLTLLFGLTNSSSSSEVQQFIPQIFETCQILATGSDQTALATRHSAPARKLLIKTMRISLLHAIALADGGVDGAADQVQNMLETGIQVLLEWLADTDTPVRQAASKALGIVVLQLESTMAAEVIEAILDCLNENILLENIHNGQLVAATDLLHVDMRQYRKNVNAVNSLKWHGAMLTLGHVLFRRSPPPEQLSTILDALLMGLKFEQRSNVGTSVGVGVRDAACFGIWSLARKYTTNEINAATLNIQRPELIETKMNTLQLVATELLLAACLDPSGNLRRGASAALQELIGRHPDVIAEGIPLVQHVDYHSVARRSTALFEVVQAVAKLDRTYHSSLLFALLDWRGSRAVDADSRRQAARTIGILFGAALPTAQLAFASELGSQIGDLRSNNTGTNAATRHGLLLALSSTMDVLRGPRTDLLQLPKLDEVLSSTLADINQAAGTLTGRVTTDLVNVLEAVARVVSSICCSRNSSTLGLRCLRDTTMLNLLDRCTTATEDELVAVTVASANADLFLTLEMDSKLALLESWLPTSLPRGKNAYTCKGRLLSLSKICSLIHGDKALYKYESRTISFLSSIIQSELAIETKVNAMQGITQVLSSSNCLDNPILSSLSQAIEQGLSNYTVDQRGDIGSLLRLSSIEAVRALPKKSLHATERERFVSAIARLSAERLNKVRFAAWECLQELWIHHIPIKQPTGSIELQADTSSEQYYRQLCELFHVPWLREELLRGLSSSIAGGSDDISQTSSSAFTSYLLDLNEIDRVSHIAWLVDSLLIQLGRHVNSEDRDLLPILDTVSLILEQFHTPAQRHIETNHRSTIIHILTALQTPNADIPRIQAVIRIMSELTLVPDLRIDSADKISRKMLHKWPKVRQAAAEGIFLVDREVVPKNIDWNEKPTENKGAIVEIRKKLGVAGARPTTTST